MPKTSIDSCLEWKKSEIIILEKSGWNPIDQINQKPGYGEHATWKRWDLSLGLIELTDQTELGSEFQGFRPVTAEARYCIVSKHL